MTQFTMDRGIDDAFKSLNAFLNKPLDRFFEAAERNISSTKIKARVCGWSETIADAIILISMTEDTGKVEQLKRQSKIISDAVESYYNYSKIEQLLLKKEAWKFCA